jgi:hypothetical protein
VRKRDLTGEKPGAKSKREASATGAAEKKAAKDTLAAEKKTAAEEKKNGAAEKKVAKDTLAAEKRKAAEEKKTVGAMTKATDEKDRKRQKSDGLHQIDVKQATLSFPAPDGPQAESR